MEFYEKQFACEGTPKKQVTKQIFLFVFLIRLQKSESDNIYGAYRERIQLTEWFFIS